MRIISLSILVFVSSLVFAQQSPQYSQFIRNQYMVNPGANGVYDFMDLSVGGRWQWAGFEGSPKTSYIYFSSPVQRGRKGFMKRTYGKVRRSKKSVKHPTMRIGQGSGAFGGQIIADQYGPFRQFKFMATYAYHLPLNRKYNLSLGVSAGLANRAFLPEHAQVYSVLANTGQVDATYNTWASSQGSQNTLEAESGLYFYSNELFVGFSANQLTKDFVRFGNTALSLDPRIHYFLTGGYKFQVNNRLSITPALLMKYVRAAPLSWEIATLFDLRERVFFGLTYRHQDALVAYVGGTVTNFLRVGYSFDFSISRMVAYNFGGHELTLSFMLGRNDIRPSIR